MNQEKENYSKMDEEVFIEEWVENSNRSNEIIEKWKEYIIKSTRFANR